MVLKVLANVGKEVLIVSAGVALVLKARAVGYKVLGELAYEYYIEPRLTSF